MHALSMAMSLAEMATEEAEKRGARVFAGHVKLGRLSGVAKEVMAAVVTKLDMAEAAGCDLAALRDAIERVRPGMRTFEVSANSGAGMDEWLRFLRARAGEGRQHVRS